MALRRSPALSDERWQCILTAISPRPPTADLDRARREIDDTLNDYFNGLDAFRRLPKGPPNDYWQRQSKELRDDWRRLSALFEEAAPILFRIKRRIPWSDSDWLQRDFLAFMAFRARAAAHAVAVDILARAYKGQRDPIHDWLVGQLLDTWTGALRGNLAVWDSPRGGPPQGPLVRFLQEVVSIVDEIPNAYTIQAIVKREKVKRRKR